jgi:hypothetical protein
MLICIFFFSVLAYEFTVRLRRSRLPWVELVTSQEVALAAITLAGCIGAGLFLYAVQGL